MEKLTNQALSEVLEMQAGQQGPAVTLYVPLHGSSAPPHISQDQLTIKNMINDAVAKASELTDHSAVVEALHAQLQTLQASPALWQDKPCGMVIYARGDQLRTFALPVDTEQHAFVGDSFHVTPLLGLLHDDTAFYVLTVVQQHPTLFSGDMYGLQPLTVSLPETVDQALNIDENNQKSEQSLSAGGSSLNTNAFNGRGGARNPREEDRMRYFRLIDHILTQKLDTKRPLILAGIDAEVAEYRHISKYPRIVDAHISGSYGNAKAETLSEQAMAIVHDEIIVPRHLEAIQHFNEAKGTGAKAADDASQLKQASSEGRIDTLLLGMTRLTTDTVRDTMQPRNRLTFPTVGEDTVNDVAMQVHNTSGHVIIVDQDAMPANIPMAGILRY
jgi:hypothetical protein